MLCISLGAANYIEVCGTAVGGNAGCMLAKSSKSDTTPWINPVQLISLKKVPHTHNWNLYHKKANIMSTFRLMICMYVDDHFFWMWVLSLGWRQPSLKWKLEPFIHSETARLAAKGNKGSRKSFKALKKVKVTGWVTDLRWARNTLRSPYRRTRQHSKGGESPRKDELSVTNVAPGTDKNMDEWMDGRVLDFSTSRYF